MAKVKGKHCLWLYLALCLCWVFSYGGVEVHPHVALFATRGKASPCLKEVFQPCFMADSKEVFQPCFMADFKEQMFL